MENNWKGEASSKAFGDIIEKLQRLHSKVGPHGDIRLANLLSCGYIIDFDFVGATQYPSTFNSITRDGKRHPEVEEMIQKGDVDAMKLEKKHDWFSLSEVMRLFKPVDSAKTEDWETLCSKVAKGLPTKTLELPQFQLELKDDDMPLRGTRNTPVKEQPGAGAE